LALLAAVAGAFAYGVASILQSVGARRAVLAGHGLLGVARQGPYLAGLGCDLAGWLLSLLALRRLPLFAVQAILAGSLAVTVVLAAVVLGVAHRRADTVAIALIVAALVALAAAAGAGHPRPVGSALEWVLLAGVPVVATAAAAAARWLPPVATGAAAGLAFGGAALCARALPDPGGIAGLLTQPLAVALVAYGAAGMLAYAHALEHGDVGPVTAALWSPRSSSPPSPASPSSPTAPAPAGAPWSSSPPPWPSQPPPSSPPPPPKRTASPEPATPPQSPKPVKRHATTRSPDDTSKARAGKAH
jgi:hypothetical protein